MALAGVFATLFAWNLLAYGSSFWLTWVMSGARAILAGVIAALMLGRMYLTKSQVRAAEYVFFGGLALVFGVMRVVNLAHGSGVYVRKFEAEMRLDTELDLDQIISEFLQLAREKGYALNEIRLRMRHWLELQPPDHFLLIEPDEKLRQIIAAEIQEATNFPVATCGLEECGQREMYFGSMPVALVGQGEVVRAALPPHSHLLLLRMRSVTEALKNEKRPAPEDLLIVVSAVPDFLDWSRSVLSAVGLDPLSLEFRNANERGWQRGLEASTFVITETVTEKIIPAGVKTRVFKMISDASLAELQKFVEHLKTD